MKKTLFSVAFLGIVVACGAQSEEKTLTPQQKRMASCSEQAATKSLKGDERKAWMSSCLKKPAEKTLTPQQQKMRECNQQATQQALKGDDRKKFMSACLKKQLQ